MNRCLTVTLAALLTALTTQAQDWAKARLDKSPRHLEWVKVKQGQREVSCFIAYPKQPNASIGWTDGAGGLRQ